LTVLVAMRAGNYEKSLENSASATKEYTRGATGNNDYRGISGGNPASCVSGVVVEGRVVPVLVKGGERVHVLHRHHRQRHWRHR
jgi:hypothetical protein